jgi:uncharacterized protein
MDKKNNHRLILLILGFLAFSHGWTWLFWTISGVIGESVWEAPGVYFFYIGGAGVFFGGVLMSWVAGGRAGLGDLGRRIFNPRLVPWRWWLVILFFFPALALLSAGVSSLIGISSQPFDFSGARQLLANPIQLLTFAIFVLIIGPLPEEIGWRGFLLDRLQLRWNALTASLVLAVVWASWHIPLFFLPGYFDAFGSAPPSFLNLITGILSVVIVYTWVYNNTNRSILGVISFHFLQNFTGEMMSLSEEAQLVRTILTVIISILVLTYWGPKTLRRGYKQINPVLSQGHIR